MIYDNSFHYLLPTFLVLCLSFELFAKKFCFWSTAKLVDRLTKPDMTLRLLPQVIGLISIVLLAGTCAFVIPVAITTAFALSSVHINFLMSDMQGVAHLLTGASAQVAPEQFTEIVSEQMPKAIIIIYLVVAAMQFFVLGMSGEVSHPGETNFEWAANFAEAHGENPMISLFSTGAGGTPSTAALDWSGGDISVCLHYPAYDIMQASQKVSQNDIPYFLPREERTDDLQRVQTNNARRKS